MAERKVVENKGVTSVFEVEFKDRDEKKVATFEAPSDFKSFKTFVQNLSDQNVKDGDDVYQSPLADAYDEYMYAIETHAKQRMREQVAQESTIIKRDGRVIDLMAIPVQKAILVVNAGFAMAAATDSAPQTALAATRKKLLEQNKVKEQNGVLVVA